MILYKETKGQFISDVLDGVISDKVEAAFMYHLGRTTAESEIRSWENSLRYMKDVVDTPDIPDSVSVAIEYQVPLTSKRVDFIIAGLNEEKEQNVVIVELKQWDSAIATDKPAIIKTRFAHGIAETTHPSYQAWSYAFMLENFCEAVREENISLNPCAFLHNYTFDGIIDHHNYSKYIKLAPLFSKHDLTNLRKFISDHIKYTSDEDILWKIENGRIAPSKQLADTMSSMLQGNPEFVMIDDQKVVYETAVDLAVKSKNDPKKRKRVLIVEGGPGTGKSVLAIQLLVRFINEGIATQYVTKNSAPRAVYEVKLSGSFRRSYINNLFVGSGSFVDAETDVLGALVVDEAHRLNEKSGLFSNKGENQIKEIINAARFSVFFIDDHQRIHIKDIGSKGLIKKIAEMMGAEVYVTDLKSQFRCNGSDGYLSWIDNTLQVRESANIRLSPEDYDFRVFDSPNAMYEAVRAKNENNKSRVVAGYCWNWESKRNPDAMDICLPDFSKQWNLNNRNIPWLIDPESFEQIGCIHTCQGLELDYVGVILGDDISFKDGRIITDVTKRAPSDQSVKGFKKMLKTDRNTALQQADEIIKNTYRTLMTRGMKGCYIFCTDKNLAEHFRACLVDPHKIEQTKRYKDTETEQREYSAIRIEPDINDSAKYKDFLPLYSLKAACGYFGEGEDVEIDGWVRVENKKLNKLMFVVRAIGNSMEPRIKDGDLCIFRANPPGSREGKIVLVQLYDRFDPDTHGSYTIKEYHSKKSYHDDGSWSHNSITLKPLNNDYNTITIDSSEEGYSIIAEFIDLAK
ncbi:MAG: DUF2075 domain-containing protein [Bacteroidales bacterium]|nr:DUF2075 domain-containing protein [Bacteroidales bacterium]